MKSIVCVVHRAEINIKPWHILLGGLKEGTTRIPWLNREPYAYWKGNPAVAQTRQDLIKCNVSENQDWNARLSSQSPHCLILCVLYKKDVSIIYSFTVHFNLF